MGVIIALLIVVSVTSGGSENPLALVGKDFKSTADILGLVCFIGAIALFVSHILLRSSHRKRKIKIRLDEN